MDMASNSYKLIDSGDGRKLEQFGPYILSRPCSQAVWKKTVSEEQWRNADAIFTREEENRWIKKAHLPTQWSCDVDSLIFKIQPTDFGHLGMFAEQRPFWSWMRDLIKKQPRKIKALNLFAYSGGSTLACAQGGAEVCHLDASKGMVAWARENAALNKLEGAPIRWITDDVIKFLQREIRRQNRYDAIILDPPTFGRGAQGELFKIEQQIIPLLQMCKEVLSDHPLFILFSCHTPGFTPHALRNLMAQVR
jgi:23S rRNA (cytosine1962-C5)-methyltransferase